MAKSVLLLFLFFNVITSNAFNTLSETDPEHKLRVKVAMLLNNPNFFLEKDVKVIIKFNIDGNHRINVVNVYPQQPKIINYVKTRLNNKKVKLNTNRTSFTAAVVLKKTNDSW